MKKTQSLFYLILTMSVLSCKLEDISESRYPIFIDNKSEQVISSYLALDDGDGITYPDTTLSFNKGYIGHSTKPGNRAFRSLPLYPIAQWVDTLPKDTLSVFIFSDDTLATYRWSEIRSGYKILKRYDLSAQDFEKLNYTLTYPPSEEMKDMKMYPPY